MSENAIRWTIVGIGLCFIAWYYSVKHAAIALAFAVSLGIVAYLIYLLVGLFYKVRESRRSTSAKGEE